MNKLAREILRVAESTDTELQYGVMTSATAVSIAGSSVAVTVPKLSSAGHLAAGDYVALLTAGADSVIVGAVGEPWIQGGDTLTTVGGSTHSIDYPNAFSSVPVLMGLAVRSSTGDRYTTTLKTITATRITFTVYLDGVLYSSPRQVNWSVALLG